MKLLGPQFGTQRSLGDLAARTLTVAAVLAGCLMVWRLRDALGVAFGSILLAIALDGMAAWTRARTGAPRWLALALVLVLAAALGALTFWVFGATMTAQYRELERKAPQSVHALLTLLRGDPLGREILSQGHNGLAGAAGSAPAVMTGVMAWAAQVITYVMVMIFGGVFLALEPQRYHRGLLRLIPPSQRARRAAFLDRLAHALQRWLVGRLVIMIAVGVLASLGLWALGIEAPFALGLTGALLTFVPFVGALMAVVPAIMVALAQAPVMVIWVALLFWAVHFVEGTFITPYVQDEAVEVPPVLSIFSTLVFTLLLGPVGVFLAGPLAATLMVGVEALYIEDILGERLAHRPRRIFRFVGATGDVPGVGKPGGPRPGHSK